VSELVQNALRSFGIPADESEVAMLADGYEAAHAVAARLHEIPVGTTPPASLLNPAPHGASRDQVVAPDA
jgi:hypothetical protein